jgi:hypothetical protein
MLVNVAVYVIPVCGVHGARVRVHVRVCVCVCSKLELEVRMLVYNKHLLFSMHGMNIKAQYSVRTSATADPMTWCHTPEYLILSNTPDKTSHITQ